MTDATRRATRLDLNRRSADPNWPTQQPDLQAALTILQRQAAGEPLRLLEEGGETADGEQIWVRFPDWLQALAHHYHDSHGADAPVILQQVLDVLWPGERRHGAGRNYQIAIPLRRYHFYPSENTLFYNSIDNYLEDVVWIRFCYRTCSPSYGKNWYGLRGKVKSRI